ncbi:MAG: VWA domain-containing protein, partial [Xanthomonadales bacterium]|nr:VWA domain-containing protein [Xanthomonadales bacterium]NIX12419.1 VWA domain-containing protein [Xanthomonadales bacterium]
MTPERNQVLVETEEIVVADASAEPKPAGGQRADRSIIVTANRVRHERRLAEGDAAESFSPHKGPATAGMVAAQVQAHIRHPSERLYREQYQRPDDHRVMRVAENPVSTFSIDVDTGAYSNMRRWLNQGHLPPGDAVRVEEFINYFDYAYPGPDDAGQPFLINTEI